MTVIIIQYNQVLENIVNFILPICIPTKTSSYACHNASLVRFVESVSWEGVEGFLNQGSQVRIVRLTWPLTDHNPLDLIVFVYHYS
jgi:hypothetical protein